VRYADGNLVPLPESMTSSTAAALGCRLATAYRAVRVQGSVREGESLAVHGCGGVGLSAIMVAHALGARVIAVDVRAEPLALAKQLGADVVLNARDTPDIPSAIHEITVRGADASIDALGSAATLANSIFSLRKRGRHVQIGLLTGRDQIPLALVSRLIAWELEMIGSHGLQAHAYAGLFELIESGKLDPTQVVERTLPLDQAPRELESLDDYRGCGVTVFTPQR
jgi:alcohol dehydrogenase